MAERFSALGPVLGSLLQSHLFVGRVACYSSTLLRLSGFSCVFQHILDFIQT